MELAFMLQEGPLFDQTQVEIPVTTADFSSRHNQSDTTSENAWFSFRTLIKLSVLVEWRHCMKRLSYVWGNTLAATGATISFLISLFFLFGVLTSDQSTVRGTTLAVSLNVVSFLPLLGTLMPRISGHAKGATILGLWALYLAVWLDFAYLIRGGNIFVPIALILPSAILIFVGGILVLLSKQDLEDSDRHRGTALEQQIQLDVI